MIKSINTEMEYYYITIWAVKSSRKNSASYTKTFGCFSQEKNIKSEIGTSDLRELEEFLNLNIFEKDLYRITASIGGIVHNWNTGIYNGEKCIEKFNILRELINLKAKNDVIS